LYQSGAPDSAGKRCVVEPGVVLGELNCKLTPHGLRFPVDIFTASRATIGGMVGNNSCGAHGTLAFSSRIELNSPRSGRIVINSTRPRSG
jgi:FAD/FMN-containing dehydrogenase